MAEDVHVDDLQDDVAGHARSDHAPRDIFGVKRAVISFLAGDVYDPGPVRRRMFAFRGIYYLSSLKHWPRALRATLNRKSAIRPQTIFATDGSG